MNKMEEKKMAEVVKKPIKITETILRDAHQSLIATRMTTEHMLPIVENTDNINTVCNRLLNEIFYYIICIRTIS